MSIIGILAGAGIQLAAPVAKRIGEAAVDKFAEKYVADKIGGALDKTISAIVGAWKQGHGQSLVQVSQSLRVEPYVLLDARVTRLPYIKDAMQLAQKLYTGYYLLANAADNTISGAKVSKRLDKFATDRDLQAATIQFLDMQSKDYSLFSAESYQFGLPFVGEAAGLQRWQDYSTEASDPTKGGDKGNGTSFKNNNTVTDVANLAIGQIVDIEITDGQNKGTIPVMIRMRPMGMDPFAMSELLALGGESDKLADRLQKFRLGDIKSFMDLITKQDQVRRYRQAMWADKSGYFRKALSRDNKALLATAMTGTPSVGNAVSIAILSAETAREAEDKMDGRLSDFETRQAIFDRGMMMMMLILDEDHETVTIYTRDIDDGAKYTLRDLKSAGASNNNDLADVMKTYLEGRIPGRL